MHEESKTHITKPNTNIKIIFIIHLIDTTLKVYFKSLSRAVVISLSPL